MFFYNSGTQETDIEVLTSTNSIHYTNQNTRGPHGPDYPSTSKQAPLPRDASTAWHEYRLDWMPGKTAFYIDGVLKAEHTQNVASRPGPWLWNNWR